MTVYSYLALGDSYTIGEQVPPEDNFPNQTAALLNGAAGAAVIAPPKIIAVTGWTTDELDAGINTENITGTYDIVSLLIGVNNQYRGRAVSNFKVEFEHLLQRAIQFAANKAQHVFVLSIPDWGVTPFAAGRDRKQIAVEIDAYNNVCASGAASFGTHYIDITASQRADGAKDEFLATDQLHPSGKEYAKWAAKLAEAIKKEQSI
ncbi:MAG: SGNH/GDSL hydrolase family protein [Ferruginibacter sp.]